MSNRDKPHAAFGRWLKAMREQNHLSQNRLGEIINYPPPAISRFETGERLPPAEKIKVYADALGVMVGEFAEMMFSEDRARNYKGQRLVLRDGDIAILHEPQGKEVPVTDELLTRIELEDEFSRKRKQIDAVPD